MPYEMIKKISAFRDGFSLCRPDLKNKDECYGVA